MDRRQRIENIIIGTLLESKGETNYYDECRVLNADMFMDEVNRRVFLLVAEMNKNGKVCTTPCDIFDEYGEKVADIVPRMCELVIDFSFIHLKAEYNERQYLYGNVGPTDVNFTDYVNRFMINYYEGITDTRQGVAA